MNNPNFREGVIPHIWTNEGKDQWYAYQPVKSDYRKVTEKSRITCLYFGNGHNRRNAGRSRTGINLGQDRGKKVLHVYI